MSDFVDISAQEDYVAAAFCPPTAPDEATNVCWSCVYRAVNRNKKYENQLRKKFVQGTLQNNKKFCHKPSTACSLSNHVQLKEKTKVKDRFSKALSRHRGGLRRKQNQYISSKLDNNQKFGTSKPTTQASVQKFGAFSVPNPSDCVCCETALDQVVQQYKQLPPEKQQLCSDIENEYRDMKETIKHFRERMACLQNRIQSVQNSPFNTVDTNMQPDPASYARNILPSPDSQASTIVQNDSLSDTSPPLLPGTIVQDNFAHLSANNSPQIEPFLNEDVALEGPLPTEFPFHTSPETQRRLSYVSAEDLPQNKYLHQQGPKMNVAEMFLRDP
eukprot:m.71447 g.71447  ORF g.71447 m.71447 type:complete len:330 (-) comp12245_c0_seq1:136-1125(-)